MNDKPNVLENVLPGMEGTAEMTVGSNDTAPRVRSGLIPVLATPVLHNLIEEAALDAIERFLPKGFQSLGTDSHIRHFAATPIGMRVTAKVTVIRADGRTIVFRAAVRDEYEDVAGGTFERSVVNVERFAGKIKKKMK